jgi:hypothetical protein
MREQNGFYIFVHIFHFYLAILNKTETARNLQIFHELHKIKFCENAFRFFLGCFMCSGNRRDVSNLISEFVQIYFRIPHRNCPVFSD